MMEDQVIQSTTLEEPPTLIEEQTPIIIKVP